MNNKTITIYTKVMFFLGMLFYIISFIVMPDEFTLDINSLIYGFRETWMLQSVGNILFVGAILNATQIRKDDN